MLMFVLSASLALAAPVPKVVLTSPAAQVQFFASSVQEGDPLVLAISLTNYSSEVLPLRHEPSRLTEDIVCEVRAHDEKEFRTVKTIEQRIQISQCGLVIRKEKDHGLAQRQTERLHLCLPLDGDTDLAVGKNYLRVRIVARQSEVVSECYEFSIVRRGEKSAKALASLNALSYSVPTMPALRDEVVHLKAAVGDLGDSSAGKVIASRLLAYEVSSADTPQGLASVLDRVESRRKEVSGLEKECLDLSVCSALLSLQKVKEAEAVIEKIQEPSVELEGLKRKLSEMKTYIK